MCADQTKVCGYHRFQQAEFSESVQVELRRLFEACSELLHQKVVLHAYTALLSRLQVESYLYSLIKGGKNYFTCTSDITSVKCMCYISFVCCCLRFSVRWPNTAVFSPTSERGHQRPV